MNGDIELEIGTGSGAGNYVVRVIRAAAGGEPVGTLKLDVGELLDKHDLLEATVLASAVPRRSVPLSEQPVQKVGRQLFEALFTGPVYGMYRASLGVAQQQGKRLRVVLRLTAPELAALPWEMLFDPETEIYLCRQEPLVRHVHAPYTTDPLQMRPPLRVLGLVASPMGLPALDVDAEKGHLAEALAEPVAEGLIELTWVPEATWQGIHARLLAGEWHVLHFVGHGDYDTDIEEGVLALVDADGRKDLVEARRLADLLGEAQPTPRLVVLNSCSSGQTGVTDLFSSTAAALVRSGISAVAAMQFAISDTAAVAFARGFYAAIAHGRGVDEAVRSGRISILGARRSLEWVTPVLYLRGNATHLFALTDTPASPAHFTGPQPPLAGKASVSSAFDQEPGGARARDTRSSLKAADDPAYVDGLSALLAGRFDEAVDHFTTLQARFPGDSLVRERLHRALLRRDCAFWYHQGVTAAERGDWDQAVAAFEQVPCADISDTDAFADTAERLSHARWQQRRSGLIDDMRRLHDAQQWKATIAVGQELVKFDPATPDPDGMITRAKDALAEEALASRYASGLQQFDSQHWPAAIDTFTRIEYDRPGYRDTPALLEQLYQRQRKQENDQLIIELQHQLRASAKTGDWAAVAIARDRLAELDPAAADPDGLAGQARKALLTQLRDLLKAHEHQRVAGNWQPALDVATEPTGLGPPSADPDGLTPDAHQELIQQISKEQEEPLEKNPLKRLWQSAKKVPWNQRPSRDDLRPVAAVLRPEERILGVCRLPFTTFSSCGLVVTNKNVHLCKGGTSDPHWTNHLGQAPLLFRTNENLVTIPWEEINECTIEEEGFRLRLMNGEEIKFPMIQWRSYSPIVARFIAAHV